MVRGEEAGLECVSIASNGNIGRWSRVQTEKVQVCDVIPMIYRSRQPVTPPPSESGYIDARPGTSACYD